jgi:benzodiazapine receptor
MVRWLLAGGFVVVVVAYAALSNAWTSSAPGWYRGLSKPSWQPPDWVFGVIWPTNFLLLVGTGIAVALRATTGQALVVLGVLVVSVVAAVSWSYLFYSRHALGPAALALAVAAVLTWVLVALVVRALGPWGAVLVVYAVWMSLAAALSAAYARLD